eukprot:436332_1
MVTDINHNELTSDHFLMPSCYLSIIVSAICWTLWFLFLYYILFPKLFTYSCLQHIKPFTKMHWSICNTLSSMPHGIIIIILCLGWEDVLIFSYTQPMFDLRTTRISVIISSISCGYFIYDTIVCCFICSKKYTQTFSYMYIFHHIICILGALVVISHVYAGGTIIDVVFIGEITNPLLQLTNLKCRLQNRQKINKQSIFIDLMLKLLYIILFIFCRFIWMINFFYQLLFVFESSIYYKIMAVLFFVLSIVLFPSLITDMRKTYLRYKGHNAKKSIQNIVVNLEMTNENMTTVSPAPVSISN